MSQDVFEGVIGNASVVNVLRVEVEGSLRMGQPLRPILMTGPPGTGKTMLSNCISRGMAAGFADVNCASLEAGDTLEGTLFHGRVKLVQIATGYMKAKPTLVLLDEAHMLPKKLQNELLKPLLEKRFQTREGTLIDMSDVMWIFATTNPEMLVQPLKDRCELQCHLDRYTVPELAQIISRFEIEDRALVDGQWVPQRFYVSFDAQICYWLASAARATPRLALNLARGYYKFLRSKVNSPAEVPALSNRDSLRAYFHLQGIYRDGLKRRDYDYLKALFTSSKPLGLPTIAAQLGVTTQEIQENVEPFLRHMNHIAMTKQGRVLTPSGRQLMSEVLGAR